MYSWNLLLKLFCMGLITLLWACSSNIPPDIREPMAGAPELSQVRASPDSFPGQKVRWGGYILATENRQQNSQIVIVAFPLDDSGRPRISGQSTGRFIAVVERFLEPLVYSQDREITLVGQVVDTETRKVGEYNYTYPVIKVENYYLWPTRPLASDYDPPYYRPYYRPYYPFYPWPYFYHRQPVYKKQPD